MATFTVPFQPLNIELHLTRNIAQETLTARFPLHRAPKMARNATLCRSCVMFQGRVLLENCHTLGTGAYILLTSQIYFQQQQD